MQQFKVGDWVENIRCVNLRIIKQVVDCKDHLDTLTVGNTTNGINVVLKSDIRLWHPQPGEWCWFWNKRLVQELRLSQFSNVFNDTYYTHTGHDFDHCEPFIGELPSFLKKQ